LYEENKKIDGDEDLEDFSIIVDEGENILGDS
jgi:hypothetical protein